jgi:hypothetical protein
MSIEDRVRAAARARTALVRDIRPLELPDERPAHTRRARRLLGWGAPVAAAALVTAVALVLVMLRQAGGPPSVPAAAPAAASVPRYYAVLDHLGGAQGVGPASSTPQQVVVADDRTGQTLAVIPPSPGQTFSGVTAAADDRTFVLSSYQAANRETTWYLLRITPGAAHPAKLTKLPIEPLPAQPTGLALSPDGRELAVMFRTAATASNTRTQLSIYSVSSGAALDAWGTDGDAGLIAGSANVDGLSWVNGDRSIAFRWAASVPGAANSSELMVRTLDVTAAGHDLLADSRLVLQVPSSVAQGGFFTDPCATSLVASDGRTVICSTVGAKAPSAACPAAPPWFVRYSTATGKPLQVLYRNQGPCVNGQALLLWTDPSGSHVIGLILLVNGKGPWPALFGVFAAGRLTPLPDLVVAGTRSRQSAAVIPGGIAF